MRNHKPGKQSFRFNKATVSLAEESGTVSRLSGGHSSITHDFDQRCQTQKGPGRSQLETFSDADFNDRQKKLLRL